MDKIYAVEFRDPDGEIIGTWSVTDAKHLLGRRVIRISQAEYEKHPEVDKRVNSVLGILEPKAKVTITPEAATFPADGVTELDIQFSGLVRDAKIAVGGQVRTIEKSNPVLTITSNVPRSFMLEINDAVQYSDRVTVEAV